MAVTHWWMFTATSSLTLYNGTMDIGDHGVSARNSASELGNNGVGVGNNDMCIDRKFRLGAWS